MSLFIAVHSAPTLLPIQCLIPLCALAWLNLVFCFILRCSELQLEKALVMVPDLIPSWMRELS